MVNGYYDRLKFEHEEKLTMAYLTAYWSAQWWSKKKPEKLDKILNRKPQNKRMTDDQMFRQVQMLHNALGGE